MKIHIHYTPKDNAWGGGNQFLKALRKELINRNLYADLKTGADAILFNSYQDLGTLIHSFFFNHATKRIYRLGPIMSMHRQGIRWKLVDYTVALLANILADMVIFQSTWSYQQSRKFGFMRKKNVFVILNAVDESIFYAKSKTLDSHPEKIRLIYTSWSKSENKGFTYLRFLENHLDWRRYEMKFIGNSPVRFNHIEMLDPLSSGALADELRQADIFVSPTKDDACSNAILEALSCGLPVVALQSGGNAELIGEGGMLFSNETEMLDAIEKVAGYLSFYQKKIITKHIAVIAQEYIDAIYASIK